MVQGRLWQPGKNKQRRQKPTPGHRWLWSLEELERRVLLAPTAYLVDSTASSVSGSGTSGSFSYVVGLANVNANPAGSQITFDPTVFSTPQTITLASALGLSETA